MERLLDDADVRALAAEATAHHTRAREQHTARPIDEATGPRGQPARWLESAVGGPLLEAFYNAPALSEHLATVTGLRWRPSGSNATYSYYRAPGHHLDLHRDVDECDLAVITCLYRSGEQLPSLELFVDAGHLSLDSIRSTMQYGAVPVDLAVGESLIVLGGFVAHRLAELGPHQVRIVAPMCFTVAR
ncbi:MAG TPA: hypothetical protein VES40_21750 [Ilumatobacteraceae bacterium]|nr:hypothetical protein [Ilumatobacteraceae bacterium]